MKPAHQFTADTTTRGTQLAQVAAIDAHLRSDDARHQARVRAERIINRFVAPVARFGSNHADPRRDTGTPEWFAAGRQARELHPQLVARILAKIERRAGR